MVSGKRAWSPPAVPKEAEAAIPGSFVAFAWQVTGRSQLAIAAVSGAVFVLETVPLELQRRMLNTMVDGAGVRVLVDLAIVYALVVLAAGLAKLLMNVHRGWISEAAVLELRRRSSAVVASVPPARLHPDVQGVGVSLLLAEPEPIGGFIGASLSELILQVGTLAAVFGYMFYVHPNLALVALAVFSPQLVFVPLMQRAINRRVQARIGVLRETSAGLLAGAGHDTVQRLRQEARFENIFELNMGIYELKFSMNFLMNLTQSAGKVAVLAVGGWQVLRGGMDVGTVVAFVSGLQSIVDPWGDLVNWFQDLTLNATKYRSFAIAAADLGRRAAVAD